MKVIDGALKKKLENLVQIIPNDDRLPIVLCTTCERKVYTANLNIDLNSNNNIVFPDFAKFYKHSIRLTRSSENKLCDCYLCELARIKGTPTKKSVPFKKKSSTKESLLNKKGHS